jgi:hypothetical protein
VGFSCRDSKDLLVVDFVEMEENPGVLLDSPLTDQSRFFVMQNGPSERTGSIRGK